jgi:NitT/TauT family transport system substrate-binding protein
LRFVDIPTNEDAMPALQLRLAAAALAAFVAVAAPAAAQKIKMSVPNVHAGFAWAYAALDKGYFAAEGLDVELVLIGGGTATPALISGSVNYTSSPSSAMSAILKGAPLKVVLVSGSRPIYELWSFDPAVTRFEDLKGKAIAIMTRGGTDEIAVRMLLKAKGLPADYVGFTALGAGATRIAALSSGAQQYSLLTRLDLAELRRTGSLDRGRMVVNVAKDVEMQTGGLVTTGKELTENRDRAKRLLRALWKGMIYMQVEREGTVELMQRRVPRLSHEEHVRDLEAAIEDRDEDGILPAESSAKELAVRGELMGLAPDAVLPPAQVYDFSLIREVTAELAAAKWRPSR